MSRTMTPGRLALWGIGTVIVGALLAGIFASAFDNDTDGAGYLVQLLSFLAYGIGILLLIGAGIAKAVQIGTRSANE